ncbi:MAG: hypothetical protein JSR97_01740 [Verrucomicrobia bacterium]|nr:hypothetical protein [Verrucomicrobiota bacterium]
MHKIILAVTILTLISTLSFGQTIDSLKLSDTEIPSDYSRPSKILCKTAHSASFYEQTDVYSTFLGTIVKKDFQSFDKKGDKGSILYFEFEKDFTGEAFLNGLLWGQPGKPTKQKPDEYYAKGKFLIIWSFDLDSEIKMLSKTKVQSVLR